MHVPRLAAAAAALATAAAVLGAAGPAAAHVSIAEPVTAGGTDEVAITVPNERDDASTVVVEVKLPEDHPLPLVTVQAKPGWQSELTMRVLDDPVELFGREVTEVVDTVRWSGGAIAPNQYDTFVLLAGPFPEGVDELVLPAIQSYDTGEEVAWIEVGERVALPAPTVRVVAAGGAATGAHGEVAAGEGAAGAAEGATGAVDETSAAPAEDGATDVVSVAALVLAIAALGLGAAALLAARRS